MGLVGLPPIPAATNRDLNGSLAQQQVAAAGTEFDDCQKWSCNCSLLQAEIYFTSCAFMQYKHAWHICEKKLSLVL